ncbi:MAG: SUF system Fe-S cluster assembly protein [Melioribacteraceae bacterium]|jgi:FeS assembly SUF system protein|nr:SUF system Fe-S cluster assembly protein [Melioribacteraceae bacterium]MDD3556939.1 SUF system Fe-S cluster assembly protein [Melioribacteraceae bacterium]
MVDKGKLEQQVISVLRTIFDPEIPVDIYELGLVYEINIDEEANVGIKMTLTSPACPVAGSLPGEVKSKLENIKDINKVEVQLVWDPPWNMDLMSEEAKLQLGFI